MINVRTDLDRFTPNEVTALIAHGYSKAREALLDKKLVMPDAPKFTWDPLGNWEVVKRLRAKEFQRSRVRKWRLWSLSDPISWVTGLYALFICLLLATPTFLFALQSAEANRAAAIAQTGKAAAQEQVLLGAIAQAQSLTVSLSQGCSGGPRGVPPVNWANLQSHGSKAVDALSGARLGLARGQKYEAVQQINSAQAELDALINGAHLSCSGGANGEDPFNYKAYMQITATVRGNLDEIKRALD